jgi:cytolysin (calcineurin-like family phosphatase)
MHLQWVTRFVVPPVLLLLIVARPVAAGTPTTRNVTFITTSDCHYVEPDRHNNRNDANRQTIQEMNNIIRSDWPQELGGGRIDPPRGVCVLGDCIDDGDRSVAGRNVSAQQYDLFRQDFGLDGTDGRLAFAVFEGWGNHDGPPIGHEKHGFSFRSQLVARNQLRLARHLIGHLSDNGLHYSWDWDDVHFVQLNLYPADRQHDGVRYSPDWHNPENALAFLKQDLAQCVGDSGRPVVLMSHCGFDTDWWFPDDWKNAYDAARSYHVILYLYGHSGTGIRSWGPPGETHKWFCINDGQTEKGFFIVQIQGDHLRTAMRYKDGYTIEKAADNSVTSHWSGGWTWKWMAQRSWE